MSAPEHAPGCDASACVYECPVPSQQPTPEQVDTMRWFMACPDETPVSEVRARFDAVGLTPRLAQLAIYEALTDVR